MSTVEELQFRIEQLDRELRLLQEQYNSASEIAENTVARKSDRVKAAREQDKISNSHAIASKEKSRLILTIDKMKDLSPALNPKLRHW